MPFLLCTGNTKLGKAVWTFSVPAGPTCPGKTDLCSRHCYAEHGYYLIRSVRTSLARCWRAARRPDFAARIVAEIRRRNAARVARGLPPILLCRIHPSGDLFSAAYVRAWVAIARALPEVTFWAYTRSWRVLSLRRPLRVLAAVPNVRLWYSCDAESGLPARKPRRVRLAWMQTAPDDLPARSDLVFRIDALRSAPLSCVSLPLASVPVPVCPAENGIASHATCERCRLCFRP